MSGNSNNSRRAAGGFDGPKDVLDDDWVIVGCGGRCFLGRVVGGDVDGDDVRQGPAIAREIAREMKERGVAHLTLEPAYEILPQVIQHGGSLAVVPMIVPAIGLIDGCRAHVRADFVVFMLEQSESARRAISDRLAVTRRIADVGGGGRVVLP